MTKRIVRREGQLPLSFTTPLLSRIFSSRGVLSPDDLDHSLKGLLSPDSFLGIHEAATILADALESDASILIVGDFDADGATSCTLMVTALRSMGARQVNYLVPDRFKFGYGLTPEIVDVALQFKPDVIVTVDNGIASVEGVAHANTLGIAVVVTDHHLPGKELPAAAAIVNPNQAGCEFPSKALAGVGVAFYLLSVLRAALRSRNWFAHHPEINLASFLDLVALGTVADVVPMDQNNRRLVEEGIRRIRAGHCRPGLKAMLMAAGVNPQYLTTRDLAFSIAPRLNAAGRLQDMSIGIECLLADEVRAAELAEHLDALNNERKEIETDMRDIALAHLKELSLEGESSAGLCFYRPNWHQGVVGIVASRVKEKSHRPVIAFAPAGVGELKGSGRSVPGFHLRDALDSIATRHPGLLLKFGGHAMAAGLSLLETDYERFREAFDEEVRRTLGEARIEQVVMSDGEIAEPVTVQLAKEIEGAAPWGQGFPEPEFDGKFEILDQRIVGGRHLKLLLQPETGDPVDAICFNHGGLAENRNIRCAYRLEVNRYRGMEKPQLIVSVIL
jgi:single-stranded-DNA-specific exonuclease